MTKREPKAIDNVKSPTKRSPKIYLLAYGSLRKDEFNHQSMVRRYGPESMKWLGTTELKGFKMFDLGSYPAIAKARTDIDISLDGTLTKREPKVTVDIFELNEVAFGAIHRMETAAGYDFGVIRLPTIKRSTGEPGKPATAFIYHMDEKKITHQVVGGDWSDYLREREKLYDRTPTF